MRTHTNTRETRYMYVHAENRNRGDFANTTRAHRRVTIGCRQNPILLLLAASSWLSRTSSPMLLLLRCRRCCSSSLNRPLFKPPRTDPVDDRCSMFERWRQSLSQRSEASTLAGDPISGGMRPRNALFACVRAPRVPCETPF